MTAADRRASGLRTGARGVGELAIGFADRNVAAAFEFAQRVARAKDSEELLALHADYLKSRMAALAEQAKTLSQEAAKAADEGARH